MDTWKAEWSSGKSEIQFAFDYLQAVSLSLTFEQDCISSFEKAYESTTEENRDIRVIRAENIFESTTEEKLDIRAASFKSPI